MIFHDFLFFLPIIIETHSPTQVNLIILVWRLILTFKVLQIYLQLKTRGVQTQIILGLVKGRDQYPRQPPVLSPTPLPPSFGNVLSALEARNGVCAVSLVVSSDFPSPPPQFPSRWLTPVYTLTGSGPRGLAQEAAHPRSRPPGLYCGIIVSLEGCRQGFPREVAAGEFSPRNESGGYTHITMLA